MAAIARALHLWLIHDSVLVAALMGDAAVYDRWARGIAAGDWFGSEVFYQAPLYPYFMAAVYQVFGGDQWHVRIVQCVMGSASCALLGAAAARFFNARVGLIAGILLALYPPAIFFDGIIQKASLAMLLMAGVLLMTALWDARPGLLRAVMLGGVLGLLALTRENALIMVPVLVAWMVMGPRGAKVSSSGTRSPREKPPRLNSGQKSRAEHSSELSRPAPVMDTSTDIPAPRRALSAAGFLLGLGLVLVPIGLRNQALGGRFLLTTSNMGTNFYIGNQPGARGYYIPLREWRAEARYEQQDARELAEAAAGKPLSPSEVSRYWLNRAWSHIAANPLEWMRLLARKWFMVWNASEHLDTESIEAYAQDSWLLRGLNAVWHFGVMCPLAAVGVWTTRRHWRRLWVLYAIILSIAAGIALFFVFARFRFIMVAGLMPFAAAGLLGILQSLKRLDARALLPMLLVAALAVGAVNAAPFRQFDPLAIPLFNVAATLSDAGKLDEAIVLYERALRAAPGRPETHFGLAIALERKGDLLRAEEHYRAALRGRENQPAIRDSLMRVLLAQGFDTATASELAAITGPPGDPGVLARMAYIAMEAGLWDVAEARYRELLAISPRDFEALSNLGRVYAQQDRYTEAADQFLAALQLSPDNADLLANLSLALIDAGRATEAQGYLQRALVIDPNHALAREILGTMNP